MGVKENGQGHPFQEFYTTVSTLRKANSLEASTMFLIVLLFTVLFLGFWAKINT